eukprot:6954569-Prymnesium_polylepis.1
MYDSHAGDTNILALMKDVVESMAKQTGRTVKWSGGLEALQSQRCRSSKRTPRGRANAAFLRQSTNYAFELYVNAAGRISQQVKMSPTTKATSPAQRGENVINMESAVFICGARSETVQHARVLRSGLSMRLGR